MDTSSVSNQTRNPINRMFLNSSLIVLILLFGLTGCMVNFGSSQATETVTNSFSTGAQPAIIVETFNGRIDVQAGADGQVAVAVTKTGSGASQRAAEADLKNIDVQMTQNGDTIRVSIKRTDNNSIGNSGARVDLTVPASAMLDLTTSNGKITSTGIQGDLTLVTSNGEIVVMGGRGSQDLTTSNGRIQLEAQSARVNARTSNGPISFTGELIDGKHSFETSNGSVDISLPADSQFDLNAHTSNGRVTSEFALQSSRGSEDNELVGTVGDNPAVFIQVQTSNGSITLSKSQ